MSIDACQTLCVEDSQCFYFVYHTFTHFCQTFYLIATNNINAVWIKINNNNILQIPGQILPSGIGYGINYYGTTSSIQNSFLSGSLCQVAQYTSNVIDSQSFITGITFTVSQRATNTVALPAGYVTAFKLNF